LDSGLFLPKRMYRKTQNNPIEITVEFEEALALVESGHSPIYITGRAGTGKSTLLRHLVENSTKNMVVLAPTGTAALNVGGQTIHSFFKFPPRPLNFSDISRSSNPGLFKSLATLVIDEASMVRADLLDAIDFSLRLNRNRMDVPFGGVQIVLFGDLYQLPPVVRSVEEKAAIATRYGTPFFFNALALRNAPLRVMELERVFRQRDPEFVAILNAIREGANHRGALARLNRECWREGARKAVDITLTSTNDLADRINRKSLEALPGKEKVFVGTLHGKMVYQRERLPVPEELKLKVGTQVMFVRNNSEFGICNGTIGIVREIQECSIRVEVKAGGPAGELVEVEQAQWDSYEYSYDPRINRIEATIAGVYEQYPLILASAITIHKSQGQSLDRVEINLGRGAFAAGQLYCALSRCTRLEGLRLASPLRMGDVIVDPAIRAFSQPAAIPATLAGAC
jgi:ATP-dependent DNA helicase PIF1